MADTQPYGDSDGSEDVRTDDLQSTPLSKATRRSISARGSFGGYSSPNTSAAGELEGDTDSDLSISTDYTRSSLSQAEGRPEPPTSTFTVVVDEPDRKRAIEETDAELVEQRSQRLLPIDRSVTASFNRVEGPLPENLVPGLYKEPSEITDRGDDLHYKNRKSRSRHKGVRRPGAAQSLQDRLFDELQPINLKETDWGFFPLDSLHELITEQTASEELCRHVGSEWSERKIARYAKKICSEESIEGTEDGLKPRIIAYRKVFAILVLIDKAAAIREFIQERVNDADLPLVKSEKGRGMQRCRALGKDLICFQQKDLDGQRRWSKPQILNFERWQWTTLAPFFARSEERKEVRHYVLQDQDILPFLPDQKRDEQPQDIYGGGGRVVRADIHPDHHNFHEFFNCPRGSSEWDQDKEPPKCICAFAIKCLHSQDKESFKQEVDMLKRFSNDAHPYLISLLATYEQKGTFYLIFPRADHDLRAYWAKTLPPALEDWEGMHWMVKQCLGLAKGVLAIHDYQSTNSRLRPLDQNRAVGNHGDIKPENVLWFRDAKADGSHGGTLKLSDFGLADFSSRRTVSRDFGHVAVTCNYRAPECDLQNQGGKGRQYDMWTLGCVYLEFLVWLVGGQPMLNRFEEARKSVDRAWFDFNTVTFFEVKSNTGTGESYAIVKPAVTEVSIRSVRQTNHR